ncbi:hypothetical protein EPK99_22415 [Neorhizobium lilium]|uniref:Uncharacterized protein n=1 Tax=Neorhizobium lilium TaxID=2503024 RepID=A0A3S3S1X7_9HYPH|nr:hypothetical protein EPK99_22415 [Neorhizobium lilium]
MRHHPQNQGSTVGRAFVSASTTMDQHLTYVAMNRHRDGAQQIEVDHAALQRQEQRSPATHLAREHEDWLVVNTGVHDERLRLQAGPERRREDPGREFSGDRQHQFQVRNPEPLVPAVTRHGRGIEGVAREKAMSAINHGFEAVESVARHVFRYPARWRADCTSRLSRRKATTK